MEGAKETSDQAQRSHQELFGGKPVVFLLY